MDCPDKRSGRREEGIRESHELSANFWKIIHMNLRHTQTNANGERAENWTAREGTGIFAPTSRILGQT